MLESGVAELTGRQLVRHYCQAEKPKRQVVDIALCKVKQTRVVQPVSVLRGNSKYRSVS